MTDTFEDELTEAIPVHACIKPEPDRWGCAWSTPAGAWSIERFRVSRVDVMVVLIEGPGIKVKMHDPEARHVIELLRLRGALDVSERRERVADAALIRDAWEIVREVVDREQSRAWHGAADAWCERVRAWSAGRSS